MKPFDSAPSFLTLQRPLAQYVNDLINGNVVGTAKTTRATTKARPQAFVGQHCLYFPPLEPSDELMRHIVTGLQSRTAGSAFETLVTGVDVLVGFLD
jgi:hypothetical protein